MNSILKYPLASLLCLATPLAAQGGEHDLRTTAKKGASVWLTQESKQEQTIDMAGQQMEMGNTTVHTLQVTIKDVDDKGMLVVETKIARIHGSMTMPMMGDIEFDSTAAKTEDDGDDDGGGMGMPSPKALTKQMTALAGKTFLAKVDPFGKVSSLEGVADLLKEAAKAGGGMAAQAAGEGALRGLVESAFGVLPNKPLAIGASWDHVANNTAGRMPTNSKLQMTLAKVDDESFELTATGTVEKPVAEKAEEAPAEGDEAAMVHEMLKDMKIKNGKLSGTQRVSRKDGFVIESSNVTSMDVDMQSPMGGEMAMTVKSTTTTKRTTAEAAMPKKADAPKEPAKEEAKTGGK